MLSNYRFKFSLLGFVLSLLGVALFTALGFWQVSRAVEKQGLQDAMTARLQQPALELRRLNANMDQLQYAKVNAHGRFDVQHEILIDNELHNGQAGYHVLTPLILEDNTAVMVNRGWISQGQNRDVLPEINTPTGDVSIQGMLAPPKSKPALILAEADINPGKVWLYLDLKKYEANSGLTLMPLVLLMDAQSSHGFVREWPAYDAKVWMHIGYAIHWFVFALAVVIIYFAVNTKKRIEK